MKKTIKTFAVIFLMTFLAGCGENDNQNLSNEAGTKAESAALTEEDNKETSTDATTEVTTAEQTTMEETETATLAVIETATETTTMAFQNKVTVKVVDKINTESNYSDFALLKIQVTNNTPSSIRGIQGTLYVDDMFGENFMRIGWDFDGKTIYSNQTVTYDSEGVEINPFMSEDSKLLHTEYQDLRFRYVIKQIVYGDGTSESA